MNHKDIKSMGKKRCFRCSKKLLPGGLSYLINIRVISDFDGVLIEPEEGVDRQLEKAIKQVEKLDPEKLEREIYEEFTLVLCKRCRDRFVEEIKYSWEGLFKLKKESDITIN